MLKRIIFCVLLLLGELVPAHAEMLYTTIEGAIFVVDSDRKPVNNHGLNPGTVNAQLTARVYDQQTFGRSDFKPLDTLNVKVTEPDGNVPTAFAKHEVTVYKLFERAAVVSWDYPGMGGFEIEGEPIEIVAHRPPITDWPLYLRKAYSSVGNRRFEVDEIIRNQASLDAELRAALVIAKSLLSEPTPEGSSDPEFYSARGKDFERLALLVKQFIRSSTLLSPDDVNYLQFLPNRTDFKSLPVEYRFNILKDFALAFSDSALRDQYFTDTLTLGPVDNHLEAMSAATRFQHAA